MPSPAAIGKGAIRRILRAANPRWEELIVDYRTLHEVSRPRTDFQWKPMPRCPQGRLDAGGATIGERLFVLGGYVSHDEVLSLVDVFDMRTARWTGRWPAPSRMAQTHAAVASDSMRHIYVVSGQLGNHCKPATRHAFVLDTDAQHWHELPPLPEARYAATMALWRGRLHVVGGSREDRHTPSVDHWSLGVEGTRALEAEWRPEPPIPIGGPHRASIVADDRFYVFGGQVGDWIAVPADPDCRCTGTLTREECHPQSFVLEPDAQEWTAIAPMPMPVSHTESSRVSINGAVYLFGGQCALADDPYGSAVTDLIQRYEVRQDRWSLAGTLPYRVKANVVGHIDDWVFSVGGQRDRAADDPSPGSFVGHCWRARLI